MMSNRWRNLEMILAVALIALGICGAVVLLTPPARAEGQVIEFNGQTLDLSGASNVMVQSSNDVRVFDADEQGGVVTVTTSIVTVTVWMRP
jgi:hypothetical protein